MIEKNEDIKSLLSVKEILIRSVLIFFPIIITIGTFLLIFYYVHENSEQKIIKSGEHQIVNLQKEVIIRNFKTIISDLLFISELESLKKYLAGQEDQKIEIAKTFRSLSQRKQIYDQIRYLDENGMEVVRINFNEGNPYIVHSNKLQNKGKRYYFKDAFKLDKYEIFSSPLDLNIEQGKVEQPKTILPENPIFNSIWRISRGKKYVKSMIRFGTPVFDNKQHKYGENRKRGIVLLNYFGANLAKMFEEVAANSQGRSMLLNRGGYWLKGDPKVEWGFMQEYEDIKHLTFANEFPSVWKTMLEKESGQYYNSKGLFTYTTVFPLKIGLRSSTGSGHAFEASSGYLEKKDYFWKIVSFVPIGILKSRTKDLVGGLLSLYAILIIIFGTGSYFYITIRIKNQIAEEKMRSQLLETAHHAGMAEISTGIIHNIGNLLNSLSISLEVVMAKLRNSEIKSLLNANNLLQENKDQFSEFLLNDTKGKLLPEFYLKVGNELKNEHEKLYKEVKQQLQNTSTMKDIISSQQAHVVDTEAYIQKIKLASIIDDALKMLNPEFGDKKIIVNKKYSVNKEITILCQKSKLLSVLLNVFKNAFESMINSENIENILQIEIKRNSNHIELHISDNGEGILKKNLITIFNHGFTTKEKGHGFGLHTCANTIAEIGGKIYASSKGPGLGSTFSIKIPIQS